MEVMQGIQFENRELPGLNSFKSQFIRISTYTYIYVYVGIENVMVIILWTMYIYIFIYFSCF